VVEDLISLGIENHTWAKKGKGNIVLRKS